MTVSTLRHLVREKMETVPQKATLFLLVIDTTGSMKSLKDRMVRSLEHLWVCISELKCNVQVQIINMKDYGDFLVQGVRAPRDPTSSRTIYDKMDLAASLSVIRSLECDGGGDAPEAINQALADAATIVEREATVQQDVYIVFAGDAPSHGWGVNPHQVSYDAFPEELPDVQDLFLTLRRMKDRVKGCFCILFGNGILSSAGALPIFKAIAETLHGFALWSDGHADDNGAAFDAAVLGALQRGTIEASCNTHALSSLVDELVRMRFSRDEVVRQVSEEAAFRSLASDAATSKATYPKTLSVVSDVDHSVDISFERIQTFFADPSASLPKLRDLMRTAVARGDAEDEPQFRGLSAATMDGKFRSLSAAPPVHTYRGMGTCACSPTASPSAARLNSSVVREDATLADVIASLISH